MNPHIASRTYVLNGVTHREQLTPPMFVVVDTYHPCQSVTPWDCYGRKHQREINRVLQSVGIESIGLVTTKVLNTPRGSGNSGQVRFGDNMLPSVYRTAVPCADKNKARTALFIHQAKIDAWISGDRTALPVECMDNL